MEFDLMPLYMDRQRTVKGVAAEAVAEAYQKGLEHKEKPEVQFLEYWLDEKTESVVCLASAQCNKASNSVHKEAHGLVAEEIHEVGEGN